MHRDPLPPALMLLFLWAGGAWTLYSSRLACSDPDRVRRSIWMRPRYCFKSERLFRYQGIVGIWFGSLLILFGIALAIASPLTETVMIATAALSVAVTPFLVPRRKAAPARHHRH